MSKGTGLHTGLPSVDQDQEFQEFDICSLAENTRAILIGRGWECLGHWCWGDTGKGGLRRHYFDTSRPKVERIPRSDWPTHWAPLREIKRFEIKPSPAHAVAEDDLTARVADADWPFHYAPTGYITREEAQHRLLRGLKTSWTPGVVKEIRQGVRSNYPVHQIVAGPGDYGAPITIREFDPTRRDLDDWIVALGWLTALGAEKTRIVMLVARGYSMRSIAERSGKSKEWARKRYQAALDFVCDAANAVSGRG